MVKIKMLQSTELSPAGTIQEYTPKGAEYLVKEGVAEYINQSTTQKDVITNKINSDEVTQEQRDAFVNDIKIENQKAEDLVKGKTKRQIYKEALLKNNIAKTEKEALELTEEFKHEPMSDVKPTTNLVALAGFYRLDNYIFNVEEFYKMNNFFYDKNCLFWFWNYPESKYEIKDETDIMNSIDDGLRLSGQTVSTKIKSGYIEAMKRVGRKKEPKPSPLKWIQFKDKAYSLNSGNIYDVKPNYFFTNPIPFKLGTTTETPIFDKLFVEWVGENDVQTLYEMIAYCCYQSYPLQSIFALYGVGRNGKSTFLRILQKFLGKDNICSTELDLITGHNSSRFETSKMFKKLACFMGETNFTMMSKSSMLKKLTGSDLLGYEIKNKQPFDDYNYAKIVIASNTLPTSEDTSDGYYRRWIVIDFPNQFTEGKDILVDIPDSEYENLALKVTTILPKLLERGYFTGHKDPEVRKQKYIMASNPFPQFMKEYTTQDSLGYIRFSELYNHYVKYLTKFKRRVISRKEFSRIITLESLEYRKTTKMINGVYQTDNYIEGYKFMLDMLDMLKIETPPPTPETQLQISGYRAYRECNVPKNNTSIILKEKDILDMFKIKQEIEADDTNIEIFRALSHKGDVFEIKPGVYRLLE